MERGVVCGVGFSSISLIFANSDQKGIQIIISLQLNIRIMSCFTCKNTLMFTKKGLVIICKACLKPLNFPLLYISDCYIYILYMYRRIFIINCLYFKMRTTCSSFSCIATISILFVFKKKQEMWNTEMNYEEVHRCKYLCEADPIVLRWIRGCVMDPIVVGWSQGLCGGSNAD